jgi:hypothetical protein
MAIDPTTLERQRGVYAADDARAERPAPKALDHTAVARVVVDAVIDPESVSLKRAAWAYGCAKKGSPEETRLLEVLLAAVKRHADGGAR